MYINNISRANLSFIDVKKPSFKTQAIFFKLFQWNSGLYKFFGLNFVSVWNYLTVSWFYQDFRKQLTSSDLLCKLFLEVFSSKVNALIHNERIWEVVLTQTDSFVKMLYFLKHSIFFRLRTLTDIWGREMLYYKSKQISLVYNVISDVTDSRFLFKVILNKSRLIMPSVIDIFPSANWVERECWDMLGVIFLGHIDLRRILTDYGFLGHPLRKEFPLTGFLEVRYSDLYKRVVFEPVELPQELRFFDFSNPWNFNVVSNKKVDSTTTYKSALNVFDVLSQEHFWQTSLSHEQNFNKLNSELLRTTRSSIKSLSISYNSMFMSGVFKMYFVFNPFLWGDNFLVVRGKNNAVVLFLSGEVDNPFFLSYVFSSLIAVNNERDLFKKHVAINTDIVDFFRGVLSSKFGVLKLLSSSLSFVSEGFHFDKDFFISFLDKKYLFKMEMFGKLFY